MTNGKIKEWHLEAELLQKLMSGSADFTEALRDYVKKTDTINESQLSEEFLASLEVKLQSIRNTIQETCRHNDTAITKEDLDASLQTLLDTFQQIQESSGFTRQDIEDIVNEYVAEAIDASDKFDTIEQDIKNDIQAEIQPTIEDLTNVADTVTNQISELRTTVESHQEYAENTYRKNDGYITEEDLDPAIIQQIQNNTSDIENLKNSFEESENNNFAISGNKNQVLTIDNNDSIIASDIVTKINIATTEAELDQARADLLTPIMSFVTPQSVYTIRLSQWNGNSIRTLEEETKPVYIPSQPDPVYYTVHYAYDGEDYPQAVLDTLPVEETQKETGDIVVPPNVPQYIDVENGTWIFNGWSPQYAVIEDSDITFTGTWTFEEHVPETTYKVLYECSGYVPETVLAVLPKTETGKYNGELVIPSDPYSEYVLDGDLLWHFEGWDPNSGYIEDNDITFVGTWSSETVDPDDPEYQQYKDIVVPEDTTDNADDNPEESPSVVPGTNTDPSAHSDPEPSDPGDDDDTEPEESPVEPRIPLEYTDYTLTTDNIKLKNAVMQIGEAITITNPSDINSGTMSIGFYGTRFKLYGSLLETAQSVRISIDSGKQYDIKFQEKSLFTDIDTDHFCFLCVEKLSEGIHNITFVIEPGESIIIDKNISLDDGIHADLLLAEDIPGNESFEQTMFDTGDYVGQLNGNYHFIKSDTIHEIGASDYENEAFATGATGYERKLLYAPNIRKTFYMDGNGLLITLASTYEEKLAELEARIAALEA